MPLPVIFLMGPTAAGKTALAVELVKRLPIEIINVDSALVYRGLNIGAARPDADTLKLAPHRLLGFRDPAEPYSAAEFREDALREISAIHANGNIPLLVGGSMLYFKILQNGLSSLPQANLDLRAKFDAQAAADGWPALHAKLAQVDAATAARLAPNDSQRIQRALEVYELTGIPLSVHHQRQKGGVKLSDNGDEPGSNFPYNTHAFAVSTHSRSTLHHRIEARLTQMFADGLVDEVEQLYRRGDLHRNLPAIRAVGYRQVWDYLAGDYDYDAMRFKALVATRQLAKRQLTWLRSWPDLVWLYSDNQTELVETGIEQVGKVVQTAEI